MEQYVDVFYSVADNKASWKCAECGARFSGLLCQAMQLPGGQTIAGTEVARMLFADDAIALQTYLERLRPLMRCGECEKRHLAVESLAIDKANRDITRQNCRNAGIPEAFIFIQPPNRDTANWIWTHRKENLLVSGGTGSGKTTAAAAVLCKMIDCGANCRYYGSISEVKTEYFRGNDAFWRGLQVHDIVAIDEAFPHGQSTQFADDLIFELVNNAYSGKLGETKIWLLGNLPAGALAAMNRPEIVRRLERFKTGMAQVGGGFHELPIGTAGG